MPLYRTIGPIGPNLPSLEFRKQKKQEGLCFCPRCCHWLVLDRFYPSTHRKSGHSSWCTGCLSRKAFEAAATSLAGRSVSIPPGARFCKVCFEVKELGAFVTHHKIPQYTCRRCNSLQQKAYRLKNREHVRKLRNLYYKANRETIVRQRAAARKANPEKEKIQGAKRRTKKLENGGSFTPLEWERLLRRFKNRCVCCGIKAKDTPQCYLVPDHVVPIARGGSSHISNIQPLCVSDNSRKSAYHTADYRVTPFTGQAQLSLLSEPSEKVYAFGPRHRMFGRIDPCPNDGPGHDAAVCSVCKKRKRCREASRLLRDQRRALKRAAAT